MNRIISLIFFNLIPTFVFAAMTINCDDLKNSLVSNANMTGHGQYDSILSFKDGKAVLSNSSRITRRIKEKDHTAVTFKRQIPVNGKLITVTESVDFVTNEQGFVMKYLNDPNAVMELQQNAVLGQKMTVNESSKGCSLEQLATLMKSNTEKATEVVSQDRKYCSSVESILRDMGKASFNKCHDLLQKASMAYNARAQELANEQKSFIESGVINSMLTTMTSLNNCGPDEWYETMATPMGPLRVLKSGSESEAAATATVNKSESKKNGINQ